MCTCMHAFFVLTSLCLHLTSNVGLFMIHGMVVRIECNNKCKNFFVSDKVLKKSLNDDKSSALKTLLAFYQIKSMVIANIT